MWELHGASCDIVDKGVVVVRVLSHDSSGCVGCGVCEEVCAESWFKTSDRQLSRIQISRDGGCGVSAVFCNQCGECIGVCPTEAISRDKRGIVRLRKNRCVGCLSCVGFCPEDAMFSHPARAEPFNCIACGLCVEECPANVLAVVQADAPLPV